ncbi:uncharacterized protein LOC142586029 isoform X1 [Dermacentor variabilis]|uniref:uncharacterized protein LOC142586029 isoform X1 n=2 Tax=Dermacentor variabilis TaxID=34621 RepID=UPI003F5BB418
MVACWAWSCLVAGCSSCCNRAFPFVYLYAFVLLTICNIINFRFESGVYKHLRMFDVVLNAAITGTLQTDINARVCSSTMASILHHETNSPNCYCCHTAPKRPPQPASASTSSSTNDLDASLHELGMLSAVTNSRQDYVLEKLSHRARNMDSSPHHSGLCVLAMNSAYIADFSFMTSSVVPESPPSPSETVPLLTLRRPRIRALRRRHYFYQPYDYPWRQRLVDMLRTKEDESAAEFENGTDGVNKSNPGSPSKLTGTSSNASATTVAGIVRSKSLDDLEVCAKECGTKEDIETVSRKISNLHVN